MLKDLNKVTVTFKINKELSPADTERVVLDVMNVIDDNLCYVTDVKYNNKVFYHIDETTFRSTCNKIQELL